MSTTHLWAPWRMEFIKSPGPSHCVFCVLPAEKDDRKNLILFRGERAFLILNKYPYNNGHLMVVPNAHVAEYAEIDAETQSEMHKLTQRAIAALRTKYAPQGFNLGMNIGAASGAGVKDHLHLHIVPRWVGDTNFMPVVSETKCMPQHLDASYEAIESALKETRS